MLAIIVGLLLILGGVGWAILVVMACGMASRPTTNSDAAPALFGLGAIALGILILIWG